MVAAPTNLESEKEMTNFNKPRKNHQYVCINDASHSSIAELQDLLIDELPSFWRGRRVGMGEAVMYAIQFTIESKRGKSND